jgi:hypothetical protein
VDEHVRSSQRDVMSEKDQKTRYPPFADPESSVTEVEDQFLSQKERRIMSSFNMKNTL